MKNVKLFAVPLIMLLLSLLLLAAVVKGEQTLDYYQVTKDRKASGPFESSGSTSRYALTEAIVEDMTFFLTEERAKFAAPDISLYQGKFLTIFTPGISFLGVPFYTFGRLFGLPQLFTYLSTTLFALLNGYLVARLAAKFGAGTYLGLLCGFIFLFATNALAYSATFTQHHVSTALILLALLNAFGKRTWLSNIWLGVIFGMGLLADIPNSFMMFPIGLYVLIKHFSVLEGKKVVRLSFKLIAAWLVIGLLFPLSFYGWHNFQTTGSVVKIGQTVGRSSYFESAELQEKRSREWKERDPYEKNLPLNTRNQTQGFYALLISPDAGLLFYSPIVVIGALGLIMLIMSKSNKRQAYGLLISSVVLVNLVLYSMFVDPWGGWAFGPRYLIPTAALLSAALSLPLQRYRRNLPFMVLFSILLLYSLAVSVSGALTTTVVPPKIEAVSFAEPLPYTYEYNFDSIRENKSGSLLFNLVLSDYLSLRVLYLIYLAVTGLVSFELLTKVVFKKVKK